MTIQTINLGNVANDGTGDDLREAFAKVVANFAELDSRTPEATTAVNLSTGQGIFAGKDDAELQFKSLIGGTNATLTSDSESITIDVDSGVTQFLIASDSGSLTVTENTTVTIQGGNLVSTQRDGNAVVINSSALGSLSDDTNPTLSAGLNAAGYDLASVGNIDAATVNGVFNGNLTGLVHGIDIRDLNEPRETNNFDFGTVSPSAIDNIYDYIFATTDVDFGGISGIQPNVNLDFGSITT
jgi:hypothetical protein